MKTSDYGTTTLTAEDEQIFASFSGPTWASFQEFSYHSDTTDARNASENERSRRAAQDEEAYEVEWRCATVENRRAEAAWVDNGCAPYRFDAEAFAS